MSSMVVVVKRNMGYWKGVSGLRNMNMLRLKMSVSVVVFVVVRWVMNFVIRRMVSSVLRIVVLIVVVFMRRFIGMGIRCVVYLWKVFYDF